MSADLEMSPEQFRAMTLQALELVEHYYAGLSSMPVMPSTTARAVHELLFEALPQRGSPADRALATVRDVVYPLSRHNGHPRFFGYVASPGTAAAAIAEFLAAGLNANVTSWRSAPAAAEMERLTIDWLKTMIGYDTASSGLLVSGGSMANFSGLAAARTAADPNVGRLGGSQRPTLRIYVSDQGHFSIHKAARLLGIGSENVQSIPTGASLVMDLAELERRIDADLKAGFSPMCIVANAGTVNTGAFDPLADIADIAERRHLWLHVDGAYGAFSALAPSTKHLFAGIERADSVSLDPHKWLYTSVGCGCIFYRNPQPAIDAFAYDADYTRPVGLANDESFVFWDMGPELSRPFRALAVWLQIKLYGAQGLGAAIESNLASARYFASLVQSSDDFELLAPVTLSIFCFRYHPRAYTGDLDALNERILVELQRAGSSYLSNAQVGGKFALRGCVLNYRTTLRDMERLLDDVREAARAARRSEV
jgi:glutamate/tyrosine decarboxylase-like PLP-dependent enzyme